MKALKTQEPRKNSKSRANIFSKAMAEYFKLRARKTDEVKNNSQ